MFIGSLVKRLLLAFAPIVFFCFCTDTFGFDRKKEQKEQIEILWKQYYELSGQNKKDDTVSGWNEILKLKGQHVSNNRYDNVNAVKTIKKTYRNPDYFKIDREFNINGTIVHSQNKYTLSPRGIQKEIKIKETSKEFEIIAQVDKIPRVFRKYKSLYLVEIRRGPEMKKMKGVLGYKTGWFWKDKLVCEIIFFDEKTVGKNMKNTKTEKRSVVFCSKKKENRRILFEGSRKYKQLGTEFDVIIYR